MSRLIQKIPDAGAGIKKLSAAMRNRAYMHTDALKIKTKYYPGDGPGLGREINVVRVGSHQDRGIWAEFNSELGAPFGKKYIIDSNDIIRIAPKAHRSKMPKNQGSGTVVKGGKIYFVGRTSSRVRCYIIQQSDTTHCQKIWCYNWCQISKPTGCDFIKRRLPL